MCPPSDGEADVAVHLPVCGQAVQGDHRAGGEGRQPSSQLLLLHQDRHGRQGEELGTPLGPQTRDGSFMYFSSLLAASVRVEAFTPGCVLFLPRCCC